MTAPPPRAHVAVTPVALSPGEAYLQAQIDWVLAARRAAIGDLARLAGVVPALTAVGALPAGSMMAGRLRWLCDRFGVTGHGLTSPPAEPLERWTSLLADRDSGTEWPFAQFTGNGGSARAGTPVAVADLVATLPGADGLAMTLAGLITRGDHTIICAVYYRTSDREIDPDDWPACWLRDDSGQWHRTLFSSGASELNAVHWHRLDVLPPVRPSASSVEVHVCGRTSEVRAIVPLTWRTS